ncbi:hypothetical protein [Neotabrizicola sp. sgz301269]|uniref:hypothetical protein n=1 Tax=Neotabrizicola sp. sgz301269 TaxID=3276282 RepID=UPI00376F5221
MLKISRTALSVLVISGCVEPINANKDLRREVPAVGANSVSFLLDGVAISDDGTLTFSATLKNKSDADVCVLPGDPIASGIEVFHRRTGFFVSDLGDGDVFEADASSTAGHNFDISPVKLAPGKILAFSSSINHFNGSVYRNSENTLEPGIVTGKNLDIRAMTFIFDCDYRTARTAQSSGAFVEITSKSQPLGVNGDKFVGAELNANN